MESIGADFVFTGEVLGQRPMSQMRHSMKIIEKSSGLEGRLLRPLCAQLMDPTIPEQEGLIDRNKLLSISGRSRKSQLDLFQKYGISDYLPPGGGCLLTDKNFARRIKDTLDHGYRNFHETIALKWGRHFRLDDQFKVMLGRDEPENESLKSYAHPDDHIMELPDKKGPTLILKGLNPDNKILEISAGILQRFSRHKDAQSIEVNCWQAKNPGNIKKIVSTFVAEEKVDQWKI